MTPVAPVNPGKGEGRNLDRHRRKNAQRSSSKGLGYSKRTSDFYSVSCEAVKLGLAPAERTLHFGL